MSRDLRDKRPVPETEYELLGWNSDNPNALLIHRLDQLELGQTEIKDSISNLSDRVTQLEISEKLTRWFFAGAGAIVAVVAREVIPKLLQ